MLVVGLLAGCADEPDVSTIEDNVRLVPDLPGETIAVKQVSKRAITPPRIELRTGDRFHFVKSIEQRLSRVDGETPQTPLGQESVKLLLTLTVESTKQDRVLCEVAYRGVQFQSDLGGESLYFDSAGDAREVPHAARPYAGLVGNHFFLWIDRANRPLDVEGFDGFLRNCLVHYPADERQELLQQMGALADTPAARLAAARAFLDDSLALLPFGELTRGETAFPPGATWSVNWPMTHPVSIDQKLQLQLEHVEGQTAHVLVAGTLQPTSERGVVRPNGVRVALKNGRINGSCTIDLSNGLPKSSRVLREFDLELAAVGQPPITVHKVVETRLDPWNPAGP